MLNLYQIFFINGKAIQLLGEKITEYDGVIYISRDDEDIAQFKRDNIAGYVWAGVQNDS